MTGMVGKINRRKWLNHEVERLFAMIADCKRRGVRNEWRKISRATGHVETSCKFKWETEKRHIETRRQAAEAEARAAQIRGIRVPAPKDVPIKPRIANPDYGGRSTSTDILTWDREMRSRIEICGLTGGMFGDPPPGRSALDQRNVERGR